MTAEEVAGHLEDLMADRTVGQLVGPREDPTVAGWDCQEVRMSRFQGHLHQVRILR